MKKKKKKTQSMPQCLYSSEEYKDEVLKKKGLNTIEKKCGSQIVQRKH